jgi:hypothetical protein
MSAAWSLPHRPLTNHLSLRQQAKQATRELAVAINHAAVHAYCKRFGCLIQTRNIGNRFVLMFSNESTEFLSADQMITFCYNVL